MKILSKDNALLYKVRGQLEHNTWVNLILEGVTELTVPSASRSGVSYLSHNKLTI